MYIILCVSVSICFPFGYFSSVFCLFFVCFVLFQFICFHFIIIIFKIPAFLIPRRDRKGVYFYGRGGGEDLRGVGERGRMIRKYHMKNSVS